MKKFIKNLLLIVLIISAIGGQTVFAADYDLNTYIYNHLENWDAEFDIPYYKSDVLDLVKSIAGKDDYLSVSLNRLVYERSGDTATLKVDYKTTKAQEEYVNQELTKIISNIITDKMSDFEKVKTINQYLIDRFEYDDSLVSNNAYSALTTGKTTCQGYALTTCKMLDLAGVENKIVIGTLNGVGHGWNLVKLNGKWYQLDVTNNDVLGNNKYFLRKDSILKADGFTWDSSKYPQCDEDYDYTSNIANIINNQSKNYVQSSSGYKSNLDGVWSIDNGKWYFLKNTKNYAKGWNLIDDKWYFFGYDYDMITGWIYYGGKWYYCYPDSGEMASNTVINGYTVDYTGAWVA